MSESHHDAARVRPFPSPLPKRIALSSPVPRLENSSFCAALPLVLKSSITRIEMFAHLAISLLALSGLVFSSGAQGSNAVCRMLTLRCSAAVESRQNVCTAERRLAGVKQVPFAYNQRDLGASHAAFNQVPFGKPLIYPLAHRLDICLIQLTTVLSSCTLRLVGVRHTNNVSMQRCQRLTRCSRCFGQNDLFGFRKE